MVTLRSKKRTTAISSVKHAVKEPELHLITGGGGFAGFWLGKHLVAHGHQVLLVDIREPIWSLKEGMVFIMCDLTNGDAVNSLFAGVDCVYHMASYGMSGREMLNRDRIEAVNVRGTENVIKACLQNDVERLVYTSTYNVIFGGQTIEAGDESMPYLPLTEDYIERGLFCVGYGADTLTDFLHVENLAQAHRLAAEALTDKHNQIAAGQCYSISDGQPINTLTFFKPLVEGLGYSMPSVQLPVKLVYFIAFLTEWLHYLVSWVYNFQPLLTRTEVYKTGITHHFTTKKASSELGYKPTVQNDLSAVVQHYIQAGHKKPEKKPQSRFIYWLVNGVFAIIIAVLILSALPLVK